MGELIPNVIGAKTDSAVKIGTSSLLQMKTLARTSKEPYTRADQNRIDLKLEDIYPLLVE